MLKKLRYYQGAIVKWHTGRWVRWGRWGRWGRFRNGRVLALVKDLSEKITLGGIRLNDLPPYNQRRGRGSREKQVEGNRVKETG